MRDLEESCRVEELEEGWCMTTDSTLFDTWTSSLSYPSHMMVMLRENNG